MENIEANLSQGALTSSEFELSSLQHQYEALVPGKSLSLPQQLLTSTTKLGQSTIIICDNLLFLSIIVSNFHPQTTEWDAFT